MKNWFTSLNGAVTLSVLAMLTLLARTVGLDAMFVLPDEMGVRQDQPAIVALIVLCTVALFGGWIWALLVAMRGSRRGLIAALVLSLLSGLLGGMTLLVLCPDGCAVRPLGNIIVWAEFIIGLAASLALGLQLWGKRANKAVQVQEA